MYMYHVCTCACKDSVLDFTVSVIIINVLQVHCVVISSCAHVSCIYNWYHLEISVLWF